MLWGLGFRLQGLFSGSKRALVFQGCGFRAKFRASWRVSFLRVLGLWGFGGLGVWGFYGGLRVWGFRGLGILWGSVSGVWGSGLFSSFRVSVRVQGRRGFRVEALGFRALVNFAA